MDGQILYLCWEEDVKSDSESEIGPELTDNPAFSVWNNYEFQIIVDNDGFECEGYSYYNEGQKVDISSYFAKLDRKINKIASQIGSRDEMNEIPKPGDIVEITYTKKIGYIAMGDIIIEPIAPVKHIGIVLIERQNDKFSDSDIIVFYRGDIAIANLDQLKFIEHIDLKPHCEKIYQKFLAT